MAMVKCLVCGATFEEGADVCPVCGVGAENFISYAGEEVTFRRDTDEKFVIIGGGPAAKSAAEAIRQRNREAMITIVTQEAYLPYNRPMLTKGIVTDFGYNGLAVEGEEWYQQNNIFFMANTTVVKIDTDAKLIDVQLQDGGKGGVVYDKLVYALGAFCFVPPIMGHDLPHVVSVRSIADTERVRKIIGASKAIPCTACRYCEEGCPMQIPIPEIFSAYNLYLRDGRPLDEVRTEYSLVTSGTGVASSCISCGQCESACPQQIGIIGLIAECADKLEV